MSDREFVYDPENWEVTYSWEDRFELTENIDLGYNVIKRLETLLPGPDKWLVCVVLSWDDTGDPDETEYRWFDTEAEANQALNESLAGRPKV